MTRDWLIFPQEKFANDLKAYKDGPIGLVPDPFPEEILGADPCPKLLRDLGLGLKHGMFSCNWNVHHEAAT